MWYRRFDSWPLQCVWRNIKGHNFLQWSKTKWFFNLLYRAGLALELTLNAFVSYFTGWLVGSIEKLHIYVWTAADLIKKRIWMNFLLEYGPSCIGMIHKPRVKKFKGIHSLLKVTDSGSSNLISNLIEIIWPKSQLFIWSHLLFKTEFLRHLHSE